MTPVSKSHKRGWIDLLRVLKRRGVHDEGIRFVRYCSESRDRADLDDESGS